ncbi:MAG: exo-alpha-sialidase [Candidatus Aminicenantes bacterium]|nr:MAG: exo-alpha-sialidase [Candidatus Aminicenantes bacterium]
MKTAYIILILAVLLILSGCNPGEENRGDSEDLNPVIKSISPDTRALSLPAFILTVHGENFREGARIFFNDIPKTTEQVSDKQLRCQIDTVDLVRSTPAPSSSQNTTMDNLVRTIPVYVVNYVPASPENIKSNIIDFSILEHPRFIEAINISRTTMDSTFPMIAVDAAEIIHAAWKDNSDGEWNVYYRRSTDFGETWSDVEILTQDYKFICCPELAVSSQGNVYVVYSASGFDDKFDIFLRRSRDNGVTWGDVTLISKSGHSYIPDIAANKYGKVAVVWHESIKLLRSDIFFSCSDDYGDTWTESINISDNIGQSDSAVVAVHAQGNIFSAWKDNRPGEWDIFFRCSQDGGSTWNEIINLSSDVLASVRPVVACDYHGQVYVAWFDLGALNREIYFTRSWNHGQDWSNVMNISNDSWLSSEPALAVDDAGNINVAWTNYEFGTNRQDIVYSRSVYGSEPWCEGITVSAGVNARMPDYADIAVDKEGNIYLVWQQWLSNKYQIMFTSSR